MGLVHSDGDTVNCRQFAETRGIINVVLCMCVCIHICTYIHICVHELCVFFNQITPYEHDVDGYRRAWCFPVVAKYALSSPEFFSLLTIFWGPRCRHDESNTITWDFQACPCGKSVSPPHVFTDQHQTKKNTDESADQISRCSNVQNVFSLAATSCTLLSWSDGNWAGWYLWIRWLIIISMLKVIRESVKRGIVFVFIYNSEDT